MTSEPSSASQSYASLPSSAATSPTSASCLPPLQPGPSQQLFIVRHGERVDQAFGNDWIEQAFRLHHVQPGVAPPARAQRKRQSIITDEMGGYTVIQHSPTSLSPTPPNLPATWVDDYLAPSAAPPLPQSLHHATYHRFNLNMPLPSCTHIPRRWIEDYSTDSPLTQCGHWQAQTVGSAFNGCGIEVVYCSPALRCVQTAQEIINAMGITARRGWRGLRIEPGLFEWMGWYSAHPRFLSAEALRWNGLDVDVGYVPVSELPALTETQQDWYERSAVLIRRLLSSAAGNVLVVAHAASHDVLSYGLLHDVAAPSIAELDTGSRHRLYSNYCGVSRIRWDSRRGGWLVDDDSRFDLHNTANEPFSFQLSYVSVERQRRQREQQLGVSTAALILPIDSYVGAAAATSGPTAAAAADGMSDLSFARTFGFVLDAVHALSAQLLALRSTTDLTDAALSQLVRSVAEPIGAAISPLLPEWRRLAAGCDGALQSHVVRCFVCIDLLLRSTADWAAMPMRDKNLLSWTVLLHDIAKVMRWEAGPGSLIKRDPIHPFNSAIVAARIFAREGFAHGGRQGAWSRLVEEWALLVQSAIVEEEDSGGSQGGDYATSLYPLRHDNSLLPAILQQLQHLFGTNTLMADTVRLVLLHQSIPFIVAFPPASALSDAEVVELLDRRTLRLLELLHIVDSASYQMNRPDQQRAFIDEIRCKSKQLDQLLQHKEEQQAATAALQAAMEGQGNEQKEGSSSRTSSTPSSSTSSRRGSESVTIFADGGRSSISVSEHAALMTGFPSSSSFSLSTDDIGIGVDGVVLSVDNGSAADSGRSSRYSTLKEETEEELEEHKD